MFLIAYGEELHTKENSMKSLGVKAYKQFQQRVIHYAEMTRKRKRRLNL